MDPITLRIQTELLSEIESEADDLGYSSRAEYIRQLLQNRRQARKALSTDATEPVVDPNTVESNTEHINDIAAQLEAILERVEHLEQKVEANNGDTGSQEVTTATVGSDTPTESSLTPMDELESWLEEDGPQSDNAVAIIREAAMILRDDGPLKAAELKERLYENYPDAYDSKDALWASTVERLYEEAPGFSKPSYGTYAFG